MKGIVGDPPLSRAARTDRLIRRDIRTHPEVWPEDVRQDPSRWRKMPKADVLAAVHKITDEFAQRVRK